jgi:hypothetical protein
MKPHVAAHFPGTGLQSQDFVEFAIRFSLRKGQLWNQISQVLLGFCSAYLYSKGFLVSFLMMYLIIL